MKRLITILVLCWISPGSVIPQMQAATIQELIAKHEGWLVPNSLTHRLHNPGALSFAHQRGAIRGERGYAEWRTDDEGWRALDHDLQVKIAKHHPRNLRELLRCWDSAKYVGKIARELGIEVDRELYWILIPDQKCGWRLSYDVTKY